MPSSSVPLISIIMPSYNSAEFIAETIGSVLAQSVKDWELVICDDLSTDNSVEIIESFTAKDERIKLIRLSENGGAAVARNTSIEAAQGRYIAFLDSDDLWLPEKLEQQIAFMDERNAALSYTHYKIMNEDGTDTGKIARPPEKLDYKELLKSNRIGCLTAIYDTKILGKVFMPLIRKRQDYGLWLRILKSGHEAHGLQKPLAVYRNRTNSISSNKIEMLNYNWRLYREVEKMNIFKSAYYLGWNVYRKLRS